MVAHPLDTIKTRIQASSKTTRTMASVIGPNWRGLLAGMSTNLAAFPAGCSYFAVYESFKGFSEGLFKGSAYVSLGHLLAGSLAEISSIMVRYKHS